MRGGRVRLVIKDGVAISSKGRRDGDFGRSTLRLLLFCLVCVGTNAAASGQTPVAPQTQHRIDEAEDDGVLIDFRSELAYESPRLSAARKRSVLRAAGEAEGAAEINSQFTGSFTRPGGRETVYLVQRGGPRAGDPDNFQKVQLIVFEGAKPRAKVDLKNSNFILRTSDLNKDGVDELVISGSFMNMGEMSTWAELIEIKDGRLKVLKDFKTVLRDSCGSGFEDARDVQAGLVKYDPRDPAQIKVDYYRAPCSSKVDDKIYSSNFKLMPDVTTIE